MPSIRPCQSNEYTANAYFNQKLQISNYNKNVKPQKTEIFQGQTIPLEALRAG